MFGHPLLSPVVALVCGVLVLIFPKILNYVVALYLVIVGLVGIFSYLGGR